MASQRNEDSRAKFAFCGVCFLMWSRPKMPSFLRRCPVAVPKISPRHLSRRNFDRGHSLTSLYPPQAALRSLPAHRRCHCRGAEAHRCGDRGYHQGHVGFCPERENLSLRASAHTGAAIRDCKKRRRKPSLFCADVLPVVPFRRGGVLPRPWLSLWESPPVVIP